MGKKPQHSPHGVWNSCYKAKGPNGRARLPKTMELPQLQKGVHVVTSRTFRALFSTIALFLALPEHSLATTKTVGPAGQGYDYTSLKTAADAASSGDTILVWPNTGGYVETVIIKQGVKVLGQDPNNRPEIKLNSSDGAATNGVVQFSDIGSGTMEWFSFRILGREQLSWTASISEGDHQSE